MPTPLAQDLEAAELVAAAHQGLALGGGEDLHHLELAHHGSAIERNAGADPRNDRIHIGERLAAVDHLRVLLLDEDVALHVVDHTSGMAACFDGFHQTNGGIQLTVTREDDDVHGEGRRGPAKALGCPK